MNERILELLIRAKNTAGPGIASARTAMGKFTTGVKNGLKGVKNASKNVTDSFRKNWLLVAVSVAAVGMAIKKVIGIMKDWGITVSSTVENLRIRMTAALRSVEEGNKLFSQMEKLAASVAFEYREIIEGATTLSAVFKGGREEVQKYMPLILDLAAFSGLAVQDVISNFIKMYSAGAAAADMFRDRGILAMMGFQAKTSYTAKETMDMVIASWESADSKFRDLSKKLGGTWDGLMSMMKDRIFTFKKAIGEAGFFDEIKLQMQSLLYLIDDFKEKGKLDEWAKNISDAFKKALSAGQNMIATMIVGAGQIIDAWNEVMVVFTMVRIGWTKLWADSDKVIEHIEKLQKVLDKAVIAAETDFSGRMVNAIGDFKKALREARKEVEKLNKTFRDPFQMPDLAGENLYKMKGNLKDIKDDTKKTFNAMEEFAKQSARNIQDAFSDFFFDAFTGKLRTLKDVFSSFALTMGKTISNIMAQWATMIVMTGLKVAYAGMTQGAGASYPGGHAPKGYADPKGMLAKHQGGIIRRAHSGLATDEVPIIAQTGEGVISRKGMNALGRGGFDRINRGEGAGAQVSHTYIINAVDPKSFADLVRQNPGIIVEIVDKGIKNNTGLRKTIKRYS